MGIVPDWGEGDIGGEEEEEAHEGKKGDDQSSQIKSWKYDTCCYIWLHVPIKQKDTEKRIDAPENLILNMMRPRVIGSGAWEFYWKK